MTTPRFIVHVSGPERSGFVTHPSSTVAPGPSPHLTNSKRLARTWLTRPEAERFVAKVLKLRLCDEPEPGETVAWVTTAEPAAV